MRQALAGYHGPSEWGWRRAPGGSRDVTFGVCVCLCVSQGGEAKQDK